MFTNFANGFRVGASFGHLGRYTDFMDAHGCFGVCSLGTGFRDTNTHEYTRISQIVLERSLRDFCKKSSRRHRLLTDQMDVPMLCNFPTIKRSHHSPIKIHSIRALSSNIFHFSIPFEVWSVILIHHIPPTV